MLPCCCILAQPPRQHSVQPVASPRTALTVTCSTRDVCLHQHLLDACYALGRSSETLIAGMLMADSWDQGRLAEVSLQPPSASQPPPNPCMIANAMQIARHPMSNDKPTGAKARRSDSINQRLVLATLQQVHAASKPTAVVRPGQGDAGESEQPLGHQGLS